MDSLDRLAAPAADLLSRVDQVLADAGAPDGHRIWPLLRQAGALPGDVLTTVCALRAAPLGAAADRVRSQAGRYADARAALTGTGWAGAGAEAYERMREALRTHLASGPDSLAGRLEATACYLEAVAGWASASRLALARTLAEVLASAEAVAVVSGAAGVMSGGPAGAAGAAAEIGARVLAVGTEAADRADDVMRRWGPQLGPVAFRPAEGAAGRFDGVTRIGL